MRGMPGRAHGRHNIYIVWLTPKTKVCEVPHGAVGSENTKTEHAPKEVSLDKLEVGDQVDVQFTAEEDSAAHNVHQSHQMRQRHGRHRTHVGYATAITIMAPPEHVQSSSGTEAKTRDGSK